MFNWDRGGQDVAEYYNVHSKVKIKTDLDLVNGKKYLLLSLNTVDSETLYRNYSSSQYDYRNFYSATGFPIYQSKVGSYNTNNRTADDANTVFIGEPINRWWYRVNFDTGYASIYKIKANPGYAPPQAKDLIKVRSTGKVILLGGEAEYEIYYYSNTKINTFFLDNTINNVSEYLNLSANQINNLTFTLNSFTLTKDLSYIADNCNVFTRGLYTKMYKVVLNGKYKIGNKFLMDFNSHLYGYTNGEENFTKSNYDDRSIAGIYGTSKTHPSMQTINNIPRVSSVYTIAEMPERAFNININDRTGKIDKAKLYIRFNEESTKTSLLDKVRLIYGSKYSILYNNKVLFKGTIIGADDDPYLTITPNASPLINVSSPTRRSIRIDSINSEGITDYFNEFNSRDKVIVNKVFQLN